MKFGSMDIKKQEAKFLTPSTNPASEEKKSYDMEILQSEFNAASLFENPLPSLKLNTLEMAKDQIPNG